VTTDHHTVSGGLDLDNPNVTHIHALMRVLYELTVAAKTARSAVPLMEFFYSNLSETLSKIDASRFACKKGCSYCCTSWVAASTPEILYLLAQLPPDRSPEIKENISKAYSTTKGLDAGTRQRMRTPCPMLQDDSCSVYQVRPLVCRTLVSYDWTTCNRVYTHFTGERVPKSHAYDVLRNVYGLALAGALRRAGLPPYFYEFNSALDRLMSRNDAEESWLGGEDILADIPHDPGGDMFGDPWNQQVYKEAFKQSAVL
jgi:Fe-S-cluster containining protein